MSKPYLLRAASITVSLLFVGCGGGGGSDGGGSEADRVGVAAACRSTDDCPEVLTPEDELVQLICLPQFTGGYCGIPDCETAADCPAGSTCVRHVDSKTYCFRECSHKSDCNRNRPPDVEANCASNFSFNDPADDHGQKACIPPSSGL